MVRICVFLDMIFSQENCGLTPGPSHATGSAQFLIMTKTESSERAFFHGHDFPSMELGVMATRIINIYNP